MIPRGWGPPVAKPTGPSTHPKDDGCCGCCGRRVEDDPDNLILLDTQRGERLLICRECREKRPVSAKQRVAAWVTGRCA